MKNKLVVSNSSPLMNLAIIRHLHLVRDIFSEILIPQEVWKELTVDGKGKAGAAEIMQADWIKIETIENKIFFRLLARDLDTGEAAAIALALEKDADLILLDETDARNVADIYKLPKTGILGILMRAKDNGMIKEVKPLLDRLKVEANFWIADHLYNDILKRTGELS